MRVFFKKNSKMIFCMMFARVGLVVPYAAKKRITDSE